MMEEKGLSLDTLRKNAQVSICRFSTWKKIAAGVVVIAGLAGIASPSHAAPITLSDTALGNPNPPLVNAPGFQNGDFFVFPCCVVQPLNDATEDNVRWSYDFSGVLTDDVIDITVATMRLRFRTGGDTPFDDSIVLLTDSFTNRENAPGTFSGVTNFATFERTFNLLNIFTESNLILELNNNGLISFLTVNDVFPFEAEINISAVTASSTSVPEPELAFLFAFGALMLLLYSRQTNVRGVA